MIRVGFVIDFSIEWMGGINYYKNLLYAIANAKDKEIQPVVFIGNQSDKEIRKNFVNYAQIVESKIFDKKSIPWYFHKIVQTLFQSNYLLERLLKKHHIAILSHTGISKLRTVKTISWIPDFQHLHIPQMFSEKEIISRNKLYTNLIHRSDAVIVSSYDALKDLHLFAQNKITKANVLQFVSQPNKAYFKLNEKDKRRIFDKFNLEEGFFYLPNQFWKHKNHQLIFEAIKILAKENSKIALVCTGYMGDYRNKNYLNKLKQFIEQNNLEKNIILLGLVDYDDVFCLIKFSRAVINPSLFEGWSSTVEECKSVGKNMILSDLEVHKEQYPTATFFERNNVRAVVDVLKNYENMEESNLAYSNLENRTQKFAKTYLEIVKNMSHSI